MDEELENGTPPENDEQQVELPALDEGYQYQLNEDGEVDYDEDGEPIVIEAVSQTDEAPPEIETPPDDDQPAAVYLPTGEGPATARLREMLDPDVNAAVQAAIAEQVSRAMQGFGVVQANYAAAAAQHPEVFRKYGAKIQQAMSMLPEGERHTRKAVDIALMFAIEDKAGTPEFAKEMLKLAQQLNGGRETTPKPPKAPIPAASRPPSPSSGTRAQAVSSRESNINALMTKYQMTRDEAEGAVGEATRKPAGRR